MNYTDDPCMTDLTPGQVDRMAAIVGQYKPNLGGSTLYFVADFTISSDRRWTFYDVTLDFGDHNGLTVNGGLYAYGTTFTRSVGWNGIYFASGSFGRFEGTRIYMAPANTGGYALTIDNASPIITYTAVDTYGGRYSSAVHISGSDAAPIFNTTDLRTGVFYSVRVTSWAEPYFHKSDIITENTLGEATFYASGNSYTRFGHPAGIGFGYNEINGGSYGIRARGAIVDADEISENDFFNSGSADLRVENGGAIYARYDYWPGGTASVSNDGTGTTYTGNSLGASSCSDALQVQRVSDDIAIATGEVQTSYSESNNHHTIVTTASQYAEEGSSADFASPSPRAMLLDAKEKADVAREKSDVSAYADAAEVLMTLLNHYPNAKEADAALSILGHVFEPLLEKQQAAASSLLLFVNQLSDTQGPLRVKALEVLAHLYERKGNDLAAIAAIEEAVALGLQPNRFFEVQSGAFYLYFGAGRYKKAAGILAAIEPQDRMEEYAVMAMEWLFYLETGDNAKTAAPKAISVAGAGSEPSPPP